nr:MAG TPA: hypothetical protein [Caudoviricetes sp.]
MRVVRTSKAFEELEKGKMIRNVCWDEDEYIRFNSNGIMVDENNRPLDITIDRGMGWIVLD